METKKIYIQTPFVEDKTLGNKISIVGSFSIKEQCYDIRLKILPADVDYFMQRKWSDNAFILDVGFVLSQLSRNNIYDFSLIKKLS